MTIDPITGDLKIGGVILDPSISKTEFLLSEIGKNAKERIRNREWTTYTVMMPNGAENVVLAIRFKNDRIYQVEFNIVDRSHKFGEWGKYTPEEDRERVDRVLLESLGHPPYEFSWGKAEFYYDIRAGGGSGLITY